MPSRRAPRNRTITLSQAEKQQLEPFLTRLTTKVPADAIHNTIIHQNLFDAIPYLPDQCVDLLLLDPPYNLTKTFNTHTFSHRSDEDYTTWLESWLIPLLRILKPTASVYVCCDWKSSPAVYTVLKRNLVIRNRITWEREKGRGAQSNWKNCSEDIWFATVSNDYYFNSSAVKLKKSVRAPYRDSKGNPKDWVTDTGGEQYRLTAASNLWTDISIPFWSMPENTDHPTQKPEKLLAKILLASSREGDLIVDPFLGSGTTAAVAHKLNRRFCGIEVDKTYCLLAAKRLQMAKKDTTIQGYAEGVFWERNAKQKKPAF
jgi:site-specific DNA-methyltransferase (adenine-specific)